MSGGDDIIGAEKAKALLDHINRAFRATGIEESSADLGSEELAAISLQLLRSGERLRASPDGGPGGPRRCLASMYMVAANAVMAIAAEVPRKEPLDG